MNEMGEVMKQFICSNLAIGYDGNMVQENINFSIDVGDYLCIVGENGAGKSTLVKTILGLLPPIEGVVKHGESIKSTDIGYLPQQTQIQKDFPASVWEVVLSGCINKHKLRPFYNRSEKQLALKHMEKTGILDLKNKTYSRLSGGQQQRVLLSRALCATTKVLLLDEPTAGLDPKSTKELYELIKMLNEEGTTIIMITHDVNDAIPFSKHVLQINETCEFFDTKEYQSKLRGKTNE